MIRIILLRDLKAIFKIYGEIKTIWYDEEREKMFVRYKFNRNLKKLIEL